jgi:O-antigen/teichoic acid export membrane protein
VKGDKPNDSVFRPALLITAGQMVGFIATFSIPIVLVRIFGQTEFGTYKELFLIFETLLLIAPAGMSASLYYFLPKSGRSGVQYIANTLISLVFSGSICLVLLWWNADRIASWFNNPDLVQYIPYIGLYLFIMLIGMILEMLMIIRNQHRTASLTYAISSILRAVFIVVPTILFRSLELLLFGAIVFALLRLLATFFYLAREYPLNERINHEFWKSDLAYSLPYGFSTWINTIGSNIHRYAVSTYFAPATFAIYSVGTRGVPLIGFLTDSTGSILMVKMREYIRDGDTTKVPELWRDTTRKLFMIFAPFSTVLIISAHAIIVTLFTSQYVSSVPIFEVSSIGILGAAFMTHCVMRVYAQNRFLIVLNSIKVVVMLLCVVFLMNWIGLLGAISAVLITLVFSNTTQLWRSKIVMGCTVREILPWRALAAILGIATASALPALAARLITDLPAIAELFLIPALYLGTYTALIWRYGPISKDEKARILRLSRRFVSRYLMSRGKSARETH